jgi:hypothetical protein
MTIAVHRRRDRGCFGGCRAGVWLLKTPVAFRILDHPETAARAKPPIRLLVAFGPRADMRGESQECAATWQSLTMEWTGNLKANPIMPAEVMDASGGCPETWTWVFNTVEEAIVQEDDNMSLSCSASARKLCVCLVCPASS